MKKTIVLVLLYASVMGVFAQTTISGVNNGHNYVNLGLPSGTLWATTNIGAREAKDNGDYFAWGETSVKELYSWFDYKYCVDPVYGLTKYCTDSEYGSDGYVDNVKLLQSGDDAAALNWGSTWRTPTYDQWLELQLNCTWIWEMKGYKVIGPNGNSIFLPAAGSHFYYIDEVALMMVDDFEDVGSIGNYWLNSLCDEAPYQASCFYMKSDTFYISCNDRAYGFSVRPVCF